MALLLQDRNHEARALFATVDRKAFARRHEQYYGDAAASPATTSVLALQLDYIDAYLDFLFGAETGFAVARRMATKYAKFPIMAWRLLFFDIAE